MSEWVQSHVGASCRFIKRLDVFVETFHLTFDCTGPTESNLILFAPQTILILLRCGKKYSPFTKLGDGRRLWFHRLGGSKTQCMAEFLDHGSVESHRYYLSRRTVLEMLRDRGYDVADSEMARSLSEFRVEFGHKPEVERLRISASLPSNPNKKILVIFMGTEDIKTATIRGVLGQIISKESLHGLILILQSKMNHYAKKELLKFSFKVEIFQITDLLVNITKHIIGPRHEILTTAQKQQLLNIYQAEDTQLPRMLETDAIARHYGLERGQVVKVTYSDGLVGSLATYRCVT